MTEAVYDEHARLYIEFIDRALSLEMNPFAVVLGVFGRFLGDRIEGADVCDLACGEGYVSRFLAGLGAREVVGVDISSALIEEAKGRADAGSLRYVVDDAQTLGTLDTSSFDVVVSQMALMDIPDLRATFGAVARILKPGGAFVFSILHPCFEAPYRPPDEPQFLVDEDGSRVAVMVRRYASEGHWRAEGAGLRGHVGSHHRTTSTYLNELLAAGFRLIRIEEPVAPPGHGLASEVPRVLAVSARGG